MATQAQNLQLLQQLSAEIEATLQPGANVPGPALAKLLVRGLNILADETRRTGMGRYGNGKPAANLGFDNDVYTDTATGYEYLKVGGAWVYQLAKRGEPGRTPVKGTDYQDGQDGMDGNVIVDRNYAPTTAENSGYQEGDQWYHTKSASAYDRYAHLNGQWRLVFGSGTATTTPPPTVSAPTVTGFTPGAAAVGASVTINGSGFTGATAVTFNGTAANFTVLNATTISASIPVGATTGKVLVATPAGSGPSTADFTVSVAQPTSFSASYQSTQADYQAKCSVAPPSAYAYPSGSGTGSTQAAADAAAKADAVSKITCPVPLPPHRLTGPSEGDVNGVTLTTDGGAYVFHYTCLDSVANSDGKRMDLMLAGEICAAVDFPASHLNTNTAWAFTRNGQTFTGNFTDGTVILA